MKRKTKLQIVIALETAYDNISIAIQDLEKAELDHSFLKNSQSLLGEYLSDLKTHFFNKGKAP